MNVVYVTGKLGLNSDIQPLNETHVKFNLQVKSQTKHGHFDLIPVMASKSQFPIIEIITNNYSEDDRKFMLFEVTGEIRYIEGMFHVLAIKMSVYQFTDDNEFLPIKAPRVRYQKKGSK